jgi:hypothetical protein
MITKNEIEQMQRDSRTQHPDWPSHKPTTYFPDGKVIVYENMPVSKATGVTGYCKYCYTKHENWWAMDPRESNPDRDGPLLLCGECEHTSLQRFI